MKKIRKFISMAILIFFIFEMAAFPKTAFSITLKQEEKLGREFMRFVTRKYRFIKDPLIVEYVNKIGKRILAVMPPQPFKYRFFVIKQDVYNAFAGPAANIFINSGLIEAMDYEDELAGIIAHEIIHVKARHISHTIDRASKMNLATLAGILAGVFLGMAGAGDAARAASIGAMAATKSAQLSYSRQNEMQADELGIKYLTKAGYSGEGLLLILKKIRKKQWYGNTEIPSYVMTHPAIEDRMAYLDSWIEAHRKIKMKSGKKNLEFKKIHTRLVAAYGDKKPALEKMKRALKKNPDSPVFNHGYGIALARNERTKQAIIYIKKALKYYPFDSVMLKDLGEVYYMNGQYENAIKALQGSMNIDPEDFETSFLMGRVYMELGKFKDAAAAFENLLEKKPGYSRAYYYLGKAYGKEGKKGTAHYYLGKYEMMMGNYKTAVFHIKQVLKYSNNPEKKEDAQNMLKIIKKKKYEESAKNQKFIGDTMLPDHPLFPVKMGESHGKCSPALGG